MSTTCKVPNQLAATWQQRDTCSSSNMKLKNENIDLNLKPKLVKTSAWQRYLPYPPHHAATPPPSLPLSLCAFVLCFAHISLAFSHICIALSATFTRCVLLLSLLIKHCRFCQAHT